MRSLVGQQRKWRGKKRSRCCSVLYTITDSFVRERLRSCCIPPLYARRRRLVRSALRCGAELPPARSGVVRYLVPAAARRPTSFSDVGNVRSSMAKAWAVVHTYCTMYIPLEPVALPAVDTFTPSLRASRSTHQETGIPSRSRFHQIQQQSHCWLWAPCGTIALQGGVVGVWKSEDR